jgi:hypothetical protein
MANPSSQTIAEWVIENLTDESWVSLSDICYFVLQNKISTYSEDEINDLVESELQYVAEILRNKAATSQENGEIIVYEIDTEQNPYIRKIVETYPELLMRLHRMANATAREQQENSKKFEILCSNILRKLGCENANCIGGTDDSGVDFHGFGFLNQETLLMPTTSKIFVIGQAKLKQKSNSVNENDIRKFIGGALRKLNEFRKNGSISVLTPIIFAFWTSSDFDIPAKEYAKNMGIWFMNGRTFVEYLKALGLDNEI